MATPKWHVCVVSRQYGATYKICEKFEGKKKGVFEFEDASRSELEKELYRQQLIFAKIQESVKESEEDKELIVKSADELTETLERDIEQSKTDEELLEIIRKREIEEESDEDDKLINLLNQ